MSQYESLEALARVGFAFTNVLAYMVAAVMSLLAARWLFNRRAYRVA